MIGASGFLLLTFLSLPLSLDAAYHGFYDIMIFIAFQFKPYHGAAK